MTHAMVNDDEDDANRGNQNNNNNDDNDNDENDVDVPNVANHNVGNANNANNHDHPNGRIINNPHDNHDRLDNGNNNGANHAVNDQGIADAPVAPDLNGHGVVNNGNPPANDVLPAEAPDPVEIQPPEAADDAFLNVDIEVAYLGCKVEDGCILYSPRGRIDVRKCPRIGLGSAEEFAQTMSKVLRGLDPLQLSRLFSGARCTFMIDRANTTLSAHAEEPGVYLIEVTFVVLQINGSAAVVQDHKEFLTHSIPPNALLERALKTAVHHFHNQTLT